MTYKFLTTINFFELQNTQALLLENDIISKVEDSYHYNVTAGWVDPFCNNHERNLFVLEKDLLLAKKILADNL
jgi:hypothetical protein